MLNITTYSNINSNGKQYTKAYSTPLNNLTKLFNGTERTF